MEKKQNLLKDATMQIVAGGSAGFVEICLMHPLDLIKTRFQLQRGPGDPHHYNSILDCFKKMLKHEGPLSFYKGILPPILAETPKRAIKFFTFEQYKKVFLFGAPQPTAVTFTLAGLCSGLTEALVINPFEVVKVQLQADRQLLTRQPSSFALARKIVLLHGFGGNGLNKGLTATLGRHGVFNMVYFSFYFNIKDLMPSLKDPTAEFFRKFSIGLCAGVLASCVNIPFDVAKSRIQGPQPVKGQIKYKGCFNTLAMVYQEEGFRALYKGLVPKILRLGPGGGVMLIVYEYMYEFLKKTFPN